MFEFTWTCNEMLEYLNIVCVCGLAVPVLQKYAYIIVCVV